MTDRKEKLIILIKELSAKFLNSKDNKTSLITVTTASISNDFKKATVFLTVLPETKETEVLNFAKRQRKELRDFLKKNMSIKNVPFIEIEIDQGEKNRQRVEQLLK